MGQTVAGQGSSSENLDFSYSSSESIRVTGQTVLGVVLDATAALY